MSLVCWNPNRELTAFPTDILNMQREINKMFNGFFRGDTQDDGSLVPSVWTPAVDVAEHENQYVVKVELPGVTKDDVKITMQENVLTIRGEKKQETETKDSNFHRVERSYGSFQRSFSLPTHVKNEKIEASYKDGILTVTLPKAEEAKPKQIEVKVK
ncbi:MAG TPA: Hsp20/alpha crystallin family protein [Bacteroidota bacterium]|jgi:HSP20 family protein|nr:Hsp20/alpha crystallin family protein [Bacteroidota bacterium]